MKRLRKKKYLSKEVQSQRRRKAEADEKEEKRRKPKQVAVKRRKKTLDKVRGKRHKITLYNPDRIKGNKEVIKKYSNVRGADGKRGKNEYQRFLGLCRTLPPKNYPCWIYFDHNTHHFHGGLTRTLVEELGVPEDARSLTLEVCETDFHEACLTIQHVGYNSKQDAHGEIYWGESCVGKLGVMLYHEVLRRMNGLTHYPQLFFMLVHFEE